MARVITLRLREGGLCEHLLYSPNAYSLLTSKYLADQADLNVLGVETDERGGTWSVAFAYTESSWRVRE